MFATNRWFLAILVSLTPAAVPGQVWVGVETTPVSGVAHGVGGGGWIQFGRFGTTSLSLPASVTTGNPTFHGASTTVEDNNDPSVPGVVITETGAALGNLVTVAHYAGATDDPFNASFEHSFLLKFESVTAVTGNLSFSLDAAFTTFAYCRFQIDIDDNGTIDQTLVGAIGGAQSSWSTPSTIGPSGTPRYVRVTARALASSSGPPMEFYDGTFRAEFFTTRTTCSIADYGTGCGPVLTVTESLPDPFTRSLQFTMTGGFPFNIGAIVFGATQTNTPIPGTSCYLLNPATVGVQGTTGPLGSYTFNATLPIDSLLFTNVQAYAIRISPYEVKTSQGVLVVCN